MTVCIPTQLLGWHKQFFFLFAVTEPLRYVLCSCWTWLIWWVILRAMSVRSLGSQDFSATYPGPKEFARSIQRV